MAQKPTINKKNIFRVVLSLIILGNGIFLVSSYSAAQQIGEYELRENVAEPTSGITVITTQSFARTIRRGEIVAFAPNGSLIYYNSSLGTYYDVDPAPEVGRTTIYYVAAKGLSAEECDATQNCALNLLIRANITTKEEKVLWRYKTTGPPASGTKVHDIDVINETHIAVADVRWDRAFILNRETGVVEWGWNAQSEYPTASGGKFPHDWVHLNDIEVLEDGRIMLSLRNQDQVVFIDRKNGLQEQWTLGEEDNYSILQEQHNPDYIPTKNGGPALVIGDSDNNRVVEYQRQNGSWTRTWIWRDPQLDWPRDADRLPDGHTLITDSRGNRVIEVNRSGDIVWSVNIGLPYEAERLGTGSESQGGPSATQASLKSYNVSQSPSTVDSASLTFRTYVKSIVPQDIKNAVIFVMPSWMGFFELASALSVVSLVVMWVLIELWWSPLKLQFAKPIRIERK